MNKTNGTTKQRGIGIILQYAQIGLNILIQLFFTPVLLKILGSNEYGIYNLASSIIAYLSLLSFGFGASYLRFFSIYKKNNDTKGISELNGLYLIVFSIMGTIALLFGLLLTKNVNIFYNESYSTNDIEIAKQLMFFLSINLFVSFPASVFVSYITSQERFVFLKTINMGKTILSPAVSIIILYLGFGSVGMVACTTVLSIIVDSIIIFFCLSRLKMKISFKNPKINLLKEIAVFSIFIAINQIIDQINWQTDKIILGKMINGTAVAIYAVGANINTMFNSLSTAVSGVYAPKVNMIVSKNSDDMDEQLTRLMTRVGRIQWFVLALVLSGFVFFGRYFIIRWAGKEYEQSFYVALLLITPATIPLIQNIGIEIQRAKNKHQFRSIIYLIMAILNIFISIIFASIWGVTGVTLGTTISLLVANGLIMNIYYHYKLNIDMAYFWKNIINTLIAFVVPCVFGVCILLFYSFNSLIDFGLIVVAYTIIYFISIYFLALNKDEKRLIRSYVFHKSIKND